MFPLANMETIGSHILLTAIMWVSLSHHH